MPRRRILIVEETDDSGKVTHHPLKVPHLPKYLPLETVLEQLRRFVYTLRGPMASNEPAALGAADVRIIRDHNLGVELRHIEVEADMEDDISLQRAEAAERAATHVEQSESDVTTSLTDAGDVVAPDPRSEESPVEPRPALPQSSREAQGSTEVQVLVRRRALTRAERHAGEDTSRETGGVLLGAFVPRDSGILVLVAGIARALMAVRGTASLNFTPEAWADIWSRIDGHPDYRDNEGWRVIGWYHTHPGFWVYLSSMDLFIHNRYFTHRGHIALVIDPVHSAHGFFCWNTEQNRVVECPEGQLRMVDDEEFAEHLDEIGFSLPAPEVIANTGDASENRCEGRDPESPGGIADRLGDRDGRER